MTRDAKHGHPKAASIYLVLSVVLVVLVAPSDGNARVTIGSKLRSAAMDLRHAMTQTRAIARSKLPRREKARRIVRAVTGNLGIRRPEPVGLMIGTYDPIHVGHMVLARRFQQHVKSNSKEPATVYIVPKLSELCPGKQPTPTGNRLVLIRRTAGRRRGVRTFFLNTLRSFQKHDSKDFGAWVAALKDWIEVRHPGARIYHISGIDAFTSARDLAQNDVKQGRRIAVVPNKGDLQALAKIHVPKWAEVLELSPVQLHATQIRKVLARGDQPRGVDPGALELIRLFELYKKER